MPDIDEIVQTYQELNKDFDPFREQCKRADELYNLDIQVPLPNGPNYHKHIPPTARAKVDAVVDHAIVTNPAIIVTNVRAGNKHDAEADALEFGSDALRQRIDAARPHSIWRDVVKLASLHGLAFIGGPLWDANPYLTDPKRRKGETRADFERRRRTHELRKRDFMPLFIRPVAAPNVLWQPGQWPPPFLIEMSTITRKTANSLYNLSTDGKSTDLLTILAWWDTDIRATVVVDSSKSAGAEGQPYYPIGEKWNGSRYEQRQNPQDNMLGFIPLYPVSLGMGRPSNTPEEEFVGLLTHAESTLVAEARIKTALECLTETYAMPTQIVEGDNGEIQWGGLGARINVPEGFKERFGFLPQPPTNPDLYRWLGFLLQDTERYLGTDALLGVRAPGEVTIGQQATRIGQAALKVQTLLSSLNVAGSTLFQNIFKLIDIVGEELPVWGVQGTERIYQLLKPGSLSDYCPYLSFEPVPPEMEDRKINLAIALYQARLLDADTLRERFLKIKDNTLVRRRLLMEQTLAHPLIQQALGAMGLQEAGMQDILNMTGMVGGQQPTAQLVGPQGQPLESEDLVKRFARMTGATAPGGLGTIEEKAPWGGRV